MAKRTAAILEGRRHCEDKWISEMSLLTGAISAAGVTSDLALWSGSATCVSIATLDKYIAGRSSRLVPLPWPKLTAVLAGLPTST